MKALNAHSSPTSWVADFLSGQELGAGDMAAAAALSEPEANVAKASFVRESANGAREITVVMPDGTTAKAILQADEMALASQPVLRPTD